jgi:GDP-L-fucose synthase
LDTTKPDGAPRKLMDSSKILALGWKPEISLDDGIAGAYRWFLDKKAGDITLRQDPWVL